MGDSCDELRRYAALHVEMGEVRRRQAALEKEYASLAAQATDAEAGIILALREYLGRAVLVETWRPGSSAKARFALWAGGGRVAMRELIDAWELSPSPAPATGAAHAAVAIGEPEAANGRP